MDDRMIIELFFERSEQAIIELSKKYGSVCTKIAYNILNNKQDAEECVNDTIFDPNSLRHFDEGSSFIS